MDRLDILLIAVAAYVSVVSLVRLMTNRRNELVAKIRTEIDKQRATASAASDADPDANPDQEAA